MPTILYCQDDSPWLLELVLFGVVVVPLGGKAGGWTICTWLFKESWSLPYPDSLEVSRPLVDDDGTVDDEFGTNFSCTKRSTARWKSYLRFNTDLGLMLEVSFCNVGVIGAMETFLEPAKNWQNEKSCKVMAYICQKLTRQEANGWNGFIIAIAFLFCLLLPGRHRRRRSISASTFQRRPFNRGRPRTGLRGSHTVHRTRSTMVSLSCKLEHPQSLNGQATSLILAPIWIFRYVVAPVAAA